MQYYSLQHQTFITREIYNWALFPFCPSCFIHSGSINNCPLLFPSSLLNNFQLGVLIFGVISFCFFKLFMGFSWQEYWSGLPFPPPVDNFSSELFTMTHPSWVALHGVAHSFTELCRPFTTTRLWSMIHVIQQIPQCFDYCIFVVLSEVWEVYASCFVPFSQTCFGNSFFFSRYTLGLFGLVLWKMSWVFDMVCIQSVDCFG